MGLVGGRGYLVASAYSTARVCGSARVSRLGFRFLESLVIHPAIYRAFRVWVGVSQKDCSRVPYGRKIYGLGQHILELVVWLFEVSNVCVRISSLRGLAGY